MAESMSSCSKEGDDRTTYDVSVLIKKWQKLICDCFRLFLSILWDYVLVLSRETWTCWYEKKILRASKVKCKSWNFVCLQNNFGPLASQPAKMVKIFRNRKNGYDTGIRMPQNGTNKLESHSINECSQTEKLEKWKDGKVISYLNCISKLQQ